MTRFDTKLTHVGRASADRERSVDPPVTQASTILCDWLEDPDGLVADRRQARALQ